MKRAQRRSKSIGGVHYRSIPARRRRSYSPDMFSPALKRRRVARVGRRARMTDPRLRSIGRRAPSRYAGGMPISYI